MFARTQTRFILLFTVVVAIVLGGAYYWQLSEATKARLLLLDKKSERHSQTKELVGLRGQSLQTLAFDYTYWDEMVTFVANRDSAWGADNIDASLATYQADLAIVFKPGGQRVYGASSEEHSSLLSDSMLEKSVGVAIRKQFFSHFFFKSESDIVEIRTAPIQPTSDQERLTKPLGYFAVGRVWDSTYIRELGELAQVKAQIRGPDFTDDDLLDLQRETSGLFCFVLQLQGLDDRPAAYLHCTAISTVQAEIQDYHRLEMLYLFGLAAFLLIVLGLSMHFWVNRPLKFVSASLSDTHSKSLDRLIGSTTEFGRIGELIKEFQDQRAQLELEIERHRQTETALTISEQRYRITAEQTGQLMYDWDIATGNIYWAGATEQLTGYSLEEYQSIDINAWEAMIHPEDRPSAMAGLDNAAKGSGRYCVEYRLKRKDEFYVVVEDTGVFLRGDDREPYRMLGTMNDITQRKLSERVIIKNEAKYRGLFDTVNDGIFIADQRGYFIDVNNAACKQTGYTREELIGKNVCEISLRTQEQITRLFENLHEMGHMTFQTAHRRKDGTIYPIDLTLTQFDIADRGAILGVARDITEHVAAKEELVSSEQRYRAIFETANDAIFLMKDDMFVDCNRTTELMFGCARDQIIGQPPYRFSPEFQLNGKSSKEMALWLIQAAYRNEPQFFQWLHCRADGTPFDAEVSLSRLDVHGSPALLAIVRDITERKRAEEQRQDLQEKLERAKRMESLGVLAGGVAHDLNNMLGPVVGYSEILLRELEAGSKTATRAQKIMKSAQDAAGVIQDLLTLARRGRYEMAPLNLNEVVTSYLESPSLLGLKERHPDVQLVIRLSENLCPINGSSVHLAKVVMNLISNACEAMPTGGTLTIRTEQRRVDALPSGFAKLDHGEYVVFSVKDTGTGIKPEDLPKIFEPYYSRKTMGHSGSGLGLSVVYGVVKDHHGFYDVISEIGRGTEFMLFFPVSTDTVKESTSCALAVGGNEKLLIVDDSLEQREMAQEIVSTLGYQVALAEHGHAAVEYLRTHQADLIMLDMIMEPGFDGLDTYREMLKISPGQLAIVVSGFSATDRVQEIQRLGACTYVKKPYTVETIAKAIRSQLDRTDRTAPVASRQTTSLHPA